MSDEDDNLKPTIAVEKGLTQGISELSISQPNESAWLSILFPCEINLNVINSLSSWDVKSQAYTVFVTPKKGLNNFVKTYGPTCFK